jgi:hypothetical protein
MTGGVCIVVVGTVIVERLEALNMHYPEPAFDPGAIEIE